jgi:hypothetical protein
MSPENGFFLCLVAWTAIQVPVSKHVLEVELGCRDESDSSLYYYRLVVNIVLHPVICLCLCVCAHRGKLSAATASITSALIVALSWGLSALIKSIVERACPSLTAWHCTWFFIAGAWGGLLVCVSHYVNLNSRESIQVQHLQQSSQNRDQIVWTPSHFQLPPPVVIVIRHEGVKTSPGSRGSLSH